jgi:hypothetical protein
MTITTTGGDGCCLYTGELDPDAVAREVHTRLRGPLFDAELKPLRPLRAVCSAGTIPPRARRLRAQRRPGAHEMTALCFVCAQDEDAHYRYDAPTITATTPLTDRDGSPATISTSVAENRWVVCAGCRPLIRDGRREALGEMVAEVLLLDMALAGELVGLSYADERRLHHEMGVHAAEMVSAFWRRPPHSEAALHRPAGPHTTTTGGGDPRMAHSPTTCPFAGCACRAKFRLTFEWPHIVTTTACSGHRDHLCASGWPADAEHRLELVT